MSDDVERSGEIDRLKEKYPELVRVWEKRMTELHGGRERLTETLPNTSMRISSKTEGNLDI